MSPQALSLIVYIVAIAGGRFLSQGQRRVRQPLSSQWQTIMNDPTAIGVGLVTAIAIGGSVMEYALREDAPQLYATLIGLAILAGAWSTAYFANKAIGENWSASIEKTAAQRLITSGVYGVVRHPLYLSGLFVLIGTNVYFQNRWAWLGVMLALAAILLRLPIEERHLEEHFDKEYRTYKRQTKMILPWIF